MIFHWILDRLFIISQQQYGYGLFTHCLLLLARIQVDFLSALMNYEYFNEYESLLHLQNESICNGCTFYPLLRLKMNSENEDINSFIVKVQ